MTQLMEMLCQQCPKLKSLHVSGDKDKDFGLKPIENISTRNPIQKDHFHDKDLFQNLESVQIFFQGKSFLHDTKDKMKYFKDYLIAKCPKITEITTELDTNPKLDGNNSYGNYLFKTSITFSSAP